MTWTRAFGKPDGWFVRLVCRLRGHVAYQCEDECCDGRWWCRWCLAPLDSPRISAPFAESASCSRSGPPTDTPNREAESANPADVRGKDGR